MNKPRAEQEKLLDKLAANESFIALDRHLSRFNIFHATDMKRREIKHTKFLSFLLDPAKPHGLGSKFLRNLIVGISKDGDIPVLDMDLSSVEVKAEHRLGLRRVQSVGNLTGEASKKSKEEGAVDILIKIKSHRSNGKPYVIAIENKLDSKEGKNQLNKYKIAVTRDFPNDMFSGLFFVYLTDGSEGESSDQAWRPITYRENILPSLSQIIEDYEEVKSSYLASVLRDYYDLLKEQDNEKSDEIAEKIDSDLVKNLNEVFDADDIEFGSKAWQLKTEYPDATEFLRGYDDDGRLKLLRWFKSKSGPPNFRVASSNRTFFRFTFLNDKSIAIIKSISQPGWLESSTNLAAEIAVTPLNNGAAYRVVSKIILGPTTLDFTNRDSLVNSLRDKLQYPRKNIPVGSKYATVFSDESSNRDSVDEVKKYIDSMIRFFLDTKACVLNELIPQFFEGEKSHS